MEVKLSPEDELQKQYNDYKEQFESWKEKNKDAIGTNAYNQYVEQFKIWEKDVEKRRLTLKDKADREEKIRQEEESEQYREAQEAEIAATYAASQKAYLAHHQSAIEQQAMLAAQQAKMLSQTYTQHHMLQAHAAQHQIQVAHGVAHDDNADVVLREVVTAVMGTATSSSTVAQQPPTQAPPPATAPPNLWGNEKQHFDVRDSLYQRWGMKAAPAHIQPDITPKVIPPCWMLLEKMREKKMMIAPNTQPPTAGIP